MFFLSLSEHTVQLRPHLLDLSLNEAVKGEFESLFLDKERVKERSVHSKETPQFMSGAQSLENITSKGTAETGSAVSFSDDEDLSQLSGSKSTTRGRSSSSATFKSSHDASEHGKDSYRCILHREVLVQPLIEMLHYADVQLREMSSFALGRLA
ncbi:hypothetical protein CK203_042222 [Vitis vinifera]|uniref:Uncharacterized protein n=1 Tax=Vitis vinifera TaxID=29760 RepID=A0A438HPZ2_VITVI|nr:hypothetical protein CK203_042222 [Vitis vinifera]